MRKVLKHLCKFVCCVIVAVVLSGTQSQAAGAVEIQIGEAKGVVGDKIEIPIKIGNGKNVGGIDLTVVYDSKELKLVNAETGSAASKATVCDINPQEEKSSVRFVYASLDGIKADGDIIVLSFEVLENERQEHTVDVDVKKILDVDIKELSWKIKGGREIAPTQGDGQSSNPVKDPSKNQDKGNGADGTDPADPANEKTGAADKQEAELKKTPDKSEKKKIYMKTKDGIKDVTDIVGKETNENLLPGDRNQRENEKGNLGIGLGVGIAILAACIFVWYRKKRRK